MTYEKSFKEEAVRLSDEIGVKRRRNSSACRTTRWRTGGSNGSVSAPRPTSEADTSACRQTRRSSESTSWKKRTASFSGQMRFCKRHSVFSPKTGRSKSAAAVRIRGGARRQMAGHGAVSRAGTQRVRLLPLPQAQGQAEPGRASFGGDTEDTGREPLQ